jgi:hypothetical protein
MELELEKAYIEPLTGKHAGDRIEVLFNPPQYTIERGNQFSEVNVPGLQSPLLRFTRGNIRTLTMDLLFDTYTYKNGEDVRNYTDQVTDLMKIDSSLHAPPVCRFYWGKLSFKCVIERVTQRFTMFESDGTPVRATLGVTFKEYKTAEEQIQEIKASSPDRTKRRVTKQGDSLWMLAAEEYKDPTRWREIADENRIENPRFLESGVEILIPPLE